MVEVQKADGVGSVWNINSWHWYFENITLFIKKCHFLKGTQKLYRSCQKNYYRKNLENEIC